MTRPAQSREERIAARAVNLWKRYRITPEMWFTQFRVQGGRCMWCRKPGNDLGVDTTPRRGRKVHPPMVPDHQHVPPYRWRGLGHGKCNGIAGLFEAALQNPPTSWPGGVEHRLPAYLAEQLNQAAERDRARKRARRRGEPPARLQEVPGERTTYHHPLPDGAIRIPRDLEDTVLSALADLQALDRRDDGGGGVELQEGLG